MGKKYLSFLLAAAVWSSGQSLRAQPIRPGTGAEWDELLAQAKKEGKVVASIPPSADLRKGMEEAFTKRFGIGVEFFPARGSTVIRRIVEESKAGVHYFDLHIGGTESIVNGLLHENVLEPVEPWFILPQVKGAKNWWGGHIWSDSAKRFIYSFCAYQTEGLWYNPDLVRPEEFRSFDDLLDPKWRGKMGFSDPRTPGSGASMWSYMRMIKGEDYLRKLVGQKMLITRDLRLLAENLVKGRISIAIGIGYAELLPFIKEGLPVKPLPVPKEGVYATTGYGSLVVIKDAPHPSAAKVFLNWLLGKEGQEIFSRGMGEATRRLDVDTKWLKGYGVLAAKDGLTLEQFNQRENQSEERVRTVRDPGAELARRLVQ